MTRLFSLPVKCDNFRPEPDVCAFLLSHFHTDHLTGLHSGWCAGTIFCTPVTRALVLSQFDIDAHRVVGLQLDKSTTISAAGVDLRVTVLDARHIVGSCMFHVASALGVILYTGDFRYSDVHTIPSLRALAPVDHLFVDTTWLHLESEKFLSDADLLNAFGALRATLAGCVQFVVRVYLHNHFGKEPLMQLLAHSIDAVVVLPMRRMRLLQSVTAVDPTVFDMSVFRSTDDEVSSRRRIEVVSSRREIQADQLQCASSDLGVKHLAVVMSGWARMAGRSQSPLVWHLPYTLHSTRAQLHSFCESLRPQSVFALGVKPGRATAVLRNLGQYLRTPGENNPPTAAAASSLATSRCRVRAPSLDPDASCNTRRGVRLECQRGPIETLLDLEGDG